MGWFAKGLWPRFFAAFLGFTLLVCRIATADTPYPPVISSRETTPLVNDPIACLEKIWGDLETEFTLTTGFRKDDFDWSISGDSSGRNPNVLSELTWSDVDSYQVTMSNRTRVGRRFYCRGGFNYASIYSGRVQDSDYAGDNRTDEYSRSISESNDDRLWDISAGVGYVFTHLDERLIVAPLVGFSYHRQNFRITNGYQVISREDSGRETPAPLGSLSSALNSTYRAEWMGPWLGCDVRFRLDGQLPDRSLMEFGLSLELHWTDYYGEANWNLRSDLQHPVSFEHDAHGFGLSISFDWRIQLAAPWELSFTMSHLHWTTGDGVDRKFSTTGESSVRRLNDVHWDSSSFMLGTTYHF